MLRKLAIFLALWASPALAQEAIIGSGVLGTGGSPPVSYTGPGDAISSPLYFWGLRAVTETFATGGTKMLAVERSNDSAICDFNVATNGGIGTTSGTCSAGSAVAGLTLFSYAPDATCTGTIASTTLTCASASSTPHAGSTLSGAGISVPVVISSCGTFTGGAGTCTVGPFITGGAAPPTISVGETITMTYKESVQRLYEQVSGGGNSDFWNNTAAIQPILLPVCLGTSLPCIGFNGSTNYLGYVNAGYIARAQPLTVTSVGERLNTFTGYQFILGSSYSGSYSFETGFYNSANTFFIAAGSAPTATANDQQLHSFVLVGNNASSIISVDNTNSTVSPGTIGIDTNGAPLLGAIDSSGTIQDYLAGYFTEMGVWGSAFSTGNITTMCHNMRLYWGSTGSC